MSPPVEEAYRIVEAITLRHFNSFALEEQYEFWEELQDLLDTLAETIDPEEEDGTTG